MLGLLHLGRGKGSKPAPERAPLEDFRIRDRGQMHLCSREDAIRALDGEPFDVLVIGGGITGAGVALDAATRGYSVALVERGDFAIGTSSRSSKLVHGGLRYLQNFDLGLVREALLERQINVALAPHLVRPLPLIVPAFDGARPGPADRPGAEHVRRDGRRPAVAARAAAATATPSTPTNRVLRPAADSCDPVMSPSSHRLRDSNF